MSTSSAQDKMTEVERADTNQMHQVMSHAMSLSPADFERLYLQPKNAVAGDLRKKFANPTLLGILGFSVGLTPLAAEFMTWRGSGGDAVATTTCTIWFGGMLLIIAGAAEFVLGNNFPFLVFMGYGCHFLTTATTFMPFYNAIGFYNQSGSPTDPTPEFLNSYGFYPLSLMLLSMVYLVGSIRTNGIFVMIFIFASIGFGLATGSFWHLAAGNMDLGNSLLVGTGACFFGAAVLGWYLLLAAMITIMELPIPDLPIFDLSTVVKARPRVKRD